MHSITRLKPPTGCGTKNGGGADVAVVLGSGLGDFADHLGGAFTIPYGDIPHWPASRVMGHAGKLVVGTLAGKKVLALSGRVHVYEGHDLQTVTFAIRALGRLGIPRVILTNAAGGISPNCARGALMVIDDHINLLGNNPLVGPNDERFGLRFPDMTYVYSPRLRAIADETAQRDRRADSTWRLHRRAGAELRNAGGDSRVPHPRRRCGRHVHGAGSDRGPPHGHRGARHLVHYQRRRRRVSRNRCIIREVMETTQQVKGQFIALLEGIIGRL